MVYQFAGFSTATRPADVGFVGMNLACQADPPNGFGPDAKMATSQEFLDSPDASRPGADGAWIRPIAVPFEPRPLRIPFDGSLSPEQMMTLLEQMKSIDVSGVKGSGRLSCAGWTLSARFDGLYVTASGGLKADACSFVRQVACSVPPQ